MTIHHLDCATMCPFGGRVMLGSGGALVGRLVGHCLLIESSDGLILVDTGFGTGDVADPARLGGQFRAMVRPRLALAATALHQVRVLGFQAEDVRHIVLTHLDLDHAGGLGDFPHAQVHVLAEELTAARAQATRADRDRYRAAQWAHGPHWAEHRAAEGESWQGFEAVRPLPGVSPEILLVPLPGHTRGHSGVAVRRADGGWLLHGGDAYFSHTDLDPALRRPPGLVAFQRLVAADNGARLRNLERLRELRRTGGPELDLICAHDPADLARLRGGSSAVR